jgi:hypothetical protein
VGASFLLAAEEAEAAAAALRLEPPRLPLPPLLTEEAGLLGEPLSEAADAAGRGATEAERLLLQAGVEEEEEEEVGLRARARACSLPPAPSPCPPASCQRSSGSSLSSSHTLLPASPCASSSCLTSCSSGSLSRERTKSLSLLSSERLLRQAPSRAVHRAVSTALK